MIFQPGSNSSVWSVPILDDSTALEDDEIVVLSLHSSTSGVMVGTSDGLFYGTTKITIVDDDGKHNNYYQGSRQTTRVECHPPQDQRSFLNYATSKKKAS